MSRLRRYTYNRGFYRSRTGVILGVCRGLADYFDLNVFWIRIILLFMLVISGIWPVLLLYFIASLLMKPEPVKPVDTEEEKEFYDSYADSSQRAASRIKRRCHNLEKRIRRMEDVVTAREFDWDSKLNGDL
jgi:phage shock protein C